MPAHSPEFKRSKLNGPLVRKSDFLATENKIASRVTNPEECLGTFLPLGLSCFVCRPAWRLLGVGNPACSFPFHQGVGRAARQLALPTLSPSHPGEDWEAGIPEDGCPNNRRGSSGQLEPCLLGQRLQRHQRSSCGKASRSGKVTVLGRQVQPVELCSFSRTPRGEGLAYFTCWYAKTNTPIVLRGRIDCWNRPCQRRFWKPNSCLFCGLWSDLLPGTTWELGTVSGL